MRHIAAAVLSPLLVDPGLTPEPATPEAAASRAIGLLDQEPWLEHRALKLARTFGATRERFATEMATQAGVPVAAGNDPRPSIHVMRPPPGRRQCPTNQ